MTDFLAWFNAPNCSETPNGLVLLIVIGFAAWAYVRGYAAGRKV